MFFFLLTWKASFHWCYTYVRKKGIWPCLGVGECGHERIPTPPGSAACTWTFRACTCVRSGVQSGQKLRTNSTLLFTF